MMDLTVAQHKLADRPFVLSIPRTVTSRMRTFLHGLLASKSRPWLLLRG